MGACDAGRCCRESACSNTKKCCCTATKGDFVAGEVCRTAGCTVNGFCDYRGVCECVVSGGTLTQSCDPCQSISCNKCERCEAGVCVSICTQCERCDPTYGNGTCVPKCNDVTCGQCQYCNCGSCVTTGVACGSACCSFSQCCVGGACVSCDCTGQIKPGPCYACQNGLYVNQCNTSQKCCDGTCAACCVDADCPADYKCVSGNCEPKQCGDYKESMSIQCYYQACGETLSGYQLIDGNCYCGGSACYDVPINSCPTGCIPDPAASAQPLPSCTTLVCCQKYDRRPCIPNPLP